MFSLNSMRTPLNNFPTRHAGFLLLAAAAAFALPRGAAACTLPASADRTLIIATPSRPSLSSTVVVQDSNPDSDGERSVSSDQLEKYVAVYRDMQQDRGLTVESAAAKESLSLSQFRKLEQKIERDDVAREHVRIELQKAATASPAAGSAKN